MYGRTTAISPKYAYSSHHVVLLEHNATDTCTHDIEYKDLILGFSKWSECYWKNAVSASRYKGGRVRIS